MTKMMLFRINKFSAQRIIDQKYFCELKDQLSYINYINKEHTKEKNSIKHFEINTKWNPIKFLKKKILVNQKKRIN